jgi:hypothetical protein
MNGHHASAVRRRPYRTRLIGQLALPSFVAHIDAESSICDSVYEKLDTMSGLHYITVNAAMGPEAEMTYKEWEAVVNILGAVVIGAWVIFEAVSDPATSVAEAAARLLWAILFVVLFNIAAMIVMTILVSIARGQEFKDERADERDRAVSLKGMRNGYVVASTIGALSLFPLAWGYDPAVAVYVLFGGLMLAGVVDAASRLVYYRIG